MEQQVEERQAGDLGTKASDAPYKTLGAAKAALKKRGDLNGDYGLVLVQEGWVLRVLEEEVVEPEQLFFDELMERHKEEMVTDRKVTQVENMVRRNPPVLPLALLESMEKDTPHFLPVLEQVVNLLPVINKFALKAVDAVYQVEVDCFYADAIEEASNELITLGRTVDTGESLIKEIPSLYRSILNGVIPDEFGIHFPASDLVVDWYKKVRQRAVSVQKAYDAVLKPWEEVTPVLEQLYSGTYDPGGGRVGPGGHPVSPYDFVMDVGYYLGLDFSDTSMDKKTA